MAVDDPWAIDGLALSALEWRRAITGLIQHDADAVSARAGVLSGCGVTVASLTATVGAGQVVVTPTAGSNGSYIVGMTSTALTAIAAQDATFARIDRVYARVYDNAVDGSGQAKAALEIVTGTPAASPAAPALPSGAVELAQLQVPQSGGGSVVVVDKRRQAVAAGGVPWFVTTAERDVAIVAPKAGQMCVTNTGAAQALWVHSGTVWVQMQPKPADSGWVDVPLRAGFVALGTGSPASQRLRVRKIGNVVYMQGGITNATVVASTTVAVADVPAGYWPVAVNSIQAAGSSSAAALCPAFVTDAGVVELRPSGTVGSYYKFDRTYLAD